MLKRIKPEQVCLGMFIEAIDGSWEGRPFWRSRFLLDRAEDVKSLKAGGVTGVIINTNEGADIGLSTSRKTRSAPRTAHKAQVTRALETIEQSKPVIKAMFEDARMGRSLPVGNAMQVVETISACMTDSWQALVEVSRLKTRDEYTFLHSIAVTALMVHLGRSIKLDDGITRTLGVGGLLHDIGKVKIPLDILNKTGSLTDEEMALVRKHPENSHDILRQSGLPEMVLDICLHHHERLDGRGYPDGLSGDQISLPLRIASICDVYDALTSKRAYKKAWAPLEAANFMIEQEGQFDRQLLRQFFHSLGL